MDQKTGDIGRPEARATVGAAPVGTLCYGPSHMILWGEGCRVTEDRPISRNGDEWTLSHYELYVKAVRDGLDDEGIAVALGRSSGAIRARAKYLLPESGMEEPRTPKAALQSLRGLLRDDPTYDWPTAVHEYHRRHALPLWNESKDQALRVTWEGGSGKIEDLTRICEASEQQVANRLIRLGIAEDSVEVVRRLGAASGGLLATRAALARDKNAAALWVAVIADRDGSIRHLSLHQDAVHARAAIAALEQPDRERDWRTRWHWVVARRVVGEGSVREETHGSFQAPARRDTAASAAEDAET